MIAADTSLFWSVFLLFSSTLFHARFVSSRTNISHALANKMGASAAIILTSSSVFIILLILAKGTLWFLKSVTFLRPLAVWPRMPGVVAGFTAAAGIVGTEQTVLQLADPDEQT